MISCSCKTGRRIGCWSMGCWRMRFASQSFSTTATELWVKRKVPRLGTIHRSSFWCVNNKVATDWYATWEGHTGRRLIQTKQHFGNVDLTASHKARNRTIVQYGRRNHWEIIIELYYKQGKDYGFINLVTTLSVLVKLPSFNSYHHKTTIREILQKIAKHMQESVVDRRNYSRICLLIATIQERGSSAQRILSHLSSATFAKEFVDGAHLLDMTKVIWSLTQLKRPDLMENLICQMDEQRLCSFFEFKHRYAANITRSCATLGLQSPELFRIVERRSTWIVSYGSPETIADTAWACATLGHASPNLFAGIESRSEWMVSNGTPRAVADIAWACATLGYESPEFFQSIAGWAEWIVEKGDPSDVADMAWACATLGHRLPEFFEAIELRAHGLVSKGNPQAIANTIWACATLGHSSPTLLAYIWKRWDEIIAEGTEQAVENIKWACKKYGYPIPSCSYSSHQKASSMWLKDCA